MKVNAKTVSNQYLMHSHFILYLLDVQLCPVTMFELCMSKINQDFKPLWQKSKQGRIHYTDETWYNKIRVGHDPLERFIRHLSVEIGLSQTDYTNQSVRATVLEPWLKITSKPDT